MLCFNTKHKVRKCVICDIQEHQHLKYDLRDLRPGGIVQKSAGLCIFLENVKNKKLNRVMCIDCYARINHIFDFKRRIGFMPSIMQRGVDVQGMCVICFYYCPANMSNYFDPLVIKNHMLLTKVFHINFLYIIHHKKQTCEECLRNFSNFVQLHITLQRSNPRITSWLTTTTDSMTSIAGGPSASNAPRTKDPASISLDNLGVSTLFERNLPLDTHSTCNRYFKRHRDYGNGRLSDTFNRSRITLPTIEEQEQAASELTKQRKTITN